MTAVVVPKVTPVPGGAPGDTFQGAFFWTYLNDAGTMAFTGTVPATVGFEAPLGQGVFEAAPNGQISKIVSPGDTVAHIGTFDQANEASINSRGDVAFAGNLVGDPHTPSDGHNPPGFTDGVYLKQAPTGRIISIAHNGDPIPDSAGGKFDYAFGPIVNGRGQVAFVGAVQGPMNPIGNRTCSSSSSTRRAAHCGGESRATHAGRRSLCHDRLRRPSRPQQQGGRCVQRPSGQR